MIFNEKEYTKKYYEKNKERIKKQVKLWRKLNPDKVKEIQINWQKRNRKKINEWHRKYYEKNKEKCKEYWNRNRERILIYQKEYYEKNREKRLKQIKEYQKRTGYLSDKTENRRKKAIIKVGTRKKYKNRKMKCEKCGFTEKLEFHHLNPYRKDNFIVLCHNCHIQEHRKLKGGRVKNEENYEF